MYSWPIEYESLRLDDYDFNVKIFLELGIFKDSYNEKPKHIESFKSRVDRKLIQGKKDDGKMSDVLLISDGFR